MNPLYSDPIIAKLIDLIKDNTGEGTFHMYYQGDPLRIPASSLPALIISRAQTEAGQLNNAEDQHGMKMTLTVVADIRAELNDDQDIAPGTAKLYDLIEGRDATTYALKANSLLYILRHNIQLDTAKNLRIDLGQNTRIDYGLTVGKRAPDAWAIEAQIDFVVHFTQVR